MDVFSEGSRWQFKCLYRKRWVDCTDEEDRALKGAYLGCSFASPTAEYSLGQARFRTDFSRMTRTNLASKAAMSLRLEGGALPKDPPRTRPIRAARSGEAVARAGAQELPGPPPGAEALPEAEAAAEGGDGTYRFDFVLQLKDRDDFGRIMAYHMVKSGNVPGVFSAVYFKAIEVHGYEVELRSRDNLEGLLDRDECYPIRFRYDPPMARGKVLLNINEAEYGYMETNCNAIGWIILTLSGDDPVRSPDECKTHFHKRCFQRFQIYKADFEYQNYLNVDPGKDKNLDAAGPLVASVGPNLKDVFRGEQDIINLLFG